jgi:threonine/homoserine/homoserine lactone efflux protein
MSRSPRQDGATAGRPFTFREMAAFQWINPKAWAVAVTAMAVYTTPDTPFLSVVLISVTFALVNLPSVLARAGFGVALRAFPADPVRLKWFNAAMGTRLAATLWPMMSCACVQLSSPRAVRHCFGNRIIILRLALKGRSQP